MMIYEDGGNVIRALLKINDVAKNINPKESSYILDCGLIIPQYTLDEDSTDLGVYYGHSLGVIDPTILKKIGPLAHMQLVVNGKELYSTNDTCKISNFARMEYDEGVINFVYNHKYVQTEEDRDELSHEYAIQNYPSDLEFNPASITYLRLVRDFLSTFTYEVINEERVVSLRVVTYDDDYMYYRRCLEFTNNVLTDSDKYECYTKEMSDGDICEIMESESPVILDVSGIKVRVMSCLFRGFKKPIYNSCDIFYLRNKTTDIDRLVIRLKTKVATVSSSYDVLYTDLM